MDKFDKKIEKFYFKTGCKLIAFKQIKTAIFTKLHLILYKVAPQQKSIWQRSLHAFLSLGDPEAVHEGVCALG